MSKQPRLTKPMPIDSYRCADIYALEVISGKWRLAIIWTLSSRPTMRYNELKRYLPGITNIMLTRALRSLEEHGLIIREEFNQIPPHVEYSLTDKCREVLPALEIIHKWGRDLLHTRLLKNDADGVNCGNDDSEMGETN